MSAKRLVTMNAHGFSIAEALGFGWRTTTGNAAYFAGLGILLLAILLVLGAVAELVETYSEVWGLLVALVSLIVGIVLEVGIIVFSLRYCDGSRGTIADLYIHYPLGPQYFIARTIYSLLVLVGLVILIVPGVLLALVFQFCGYHIVDENVGVMESFRRSADTTKGARWRLFIFFMLLLLINFAGFLCLVVGLLLTVPATLLAYAYAFRQLQTRESGA